MLEDLDQCDMYGSDDDKCVLTINDYGMTKDPKQRVRLLKQKLANYAAAISDGLIGDQAIDRQNYQIEINCAYDPKDLYHDFQSLEILDKRGRIIRIPIHVVVRVKPLTIE